MVYNLIIICLSSWILLCGVKNLQAFVSLWLCTIACTYCEVWILLSGRTLDSLLSSCYCHTHSFYFPCTHAAQTVDLFRTGPLCPEQTVTYTCNVTQGYALHWIFEPFIPTNDAIRFLAGTPRGTSVGCNDVAAVNCADLDFMATLTNITNPMTVQGGTLADMTSIMTFTATTRLNGRVVQCRGSIGDGIINISNTTLDFSC